MRVKLRTRLRNNGSDDIPYKPDPFIVQKILTEQRWDKNQTMIVGDTASDILAGKRARVKTCGVTYGALSRREIEELQPDHIIDRFSELLTLV